MLLLCCDVDESDFDIMATYQPSSVSYKKSGLPSENEIIYRKYLCFIDRSKKKKKSNKMAQKSTDARGMGEIVPFYYRSNK